MWMRARCLRLLLEGILPKWSPKSTGTGNKDGAEAKLLRGALMVSTRNFAKGVLERNTIVRRRAHHFGWDKHFSSGIEDDELSFQEPFIERPSLGGQKASKFCWACEHLTSEGQALSWCKTTLFTDPMTSGPLQPSLGNEAFSEVTKGHLLLDL